MSQVVAFRLSEPVMSRVESSEKSTALMVLLSSLCDKTCSCVSVSHTYTPSLFVPAAIHFPSLDTVRRRTLFIPSVATCFPSSTCHTRTPPPPLLKRCFPSAEIIIATIAPLALISSGELGRSCPTIRVNAHSILSVRTSHCRRSLLATQMSRAT